MATRKRSWMREEIVLALQLYLREGVVGLKRCESLSAELRAWPIEAHFSARRSFRNAQSVRNKLYNLQWLQTDGERGRARGGKETEAVWAEFGDDLPRVDAAAAEIRWALADAERNGGVASEYEADETGVKMVAHRRRERDPSLARRKREEMLRKTGALACEACGFDSDATWGVAGIIDCHHLIPVSELEPGEKTRLRDLRLLCPSCHRLVHAGGGWLTWDELLAYVR
jgi:5-methylcytosine-specific restriction protein A